MSSNDLAAERIAQSRLDVAVLGPCYKEERAIAKVVADSRAALPGASARETKLIAYLALRAPGEERRRC
jgi:hypothetical protein